VTLGVVSIPYWWSPGRVYMDHYYELRYNLIERKRPTYKLMIGDMTKDKPWGGSLPDYILLSGPEPKIFHWTPSEHERFKNILMGYKKVKLFERTPQFLGRNFPKKSYYATEWIMPNPSQTIWKKENVS